MKCPRVHHPSAVRCYLVEGHWPETDHDFSPKRSTTLVQWFEPGESMDALDRTPEFELALVVIDEGKTVQTPTRVHSFVCLACHKRKPEKDFGPAAWCRSCELLSCGRG